MPNIESREGTLLWNGTAAGLTGLALVVLYFTVLATMANSDLTAGRHVLDMDEQVSFDGVRAILDAEGLPGFVSSVLDGHDHRYGRILWNYSALVAALPERLFGTPGQIIATRMAQYAALFAAYLLLVFTFLRSWPMRVGGLLVLLSLPATAYYSSMPKPEPLQLLFVALFLWRGAKRNFQFGPYWVFLGMAFGAKISILPVIPLFFALGCLASFQEGGVLNILMRLTVAMISFIAGFLIGEPVHLLGIYFGTLYYSHNYLLVTFKNTEHGSDMLGVTWMDWIKHVFWNYTGLPAWLAITIFVLIVIFLASIVRDRYRDLRGAGGVIHGTELLTVLNRQHGYLLMVTGFLLIAPVLFTVRRIWDMYLHGGTALMAVGLLAIAEQVMTEGSRGGAVFSRITASTARVLCAALLGVMLLFLVPKSTSEFVRLSKRTQTAEYRTKSAEHAAARRVLETVAAALQSPVRFYIDPNMFAVEPTGMYAGTQFFGPFASWNEGAEMVLFYKEHTPEGALPPQTNVHFKGALMEREIYSRYVADASGTCRSFPCYQPVATGLPELENVRIFLRDDVFATMRAKGYL